ncbi:MAG TPA: SOS response-associated peptidase [Xanthobacteraceae bacterium]|nr:SOS response-associated peptidase [Xanthobacteraceae bacterium]
MCGRFALLSAPEEIRRQFGYGEQPNFPPRYNIAPTQAVPVVFAEHGVRHFRLMRWGLIPSWVKDPKQFALLLNARIESINDKPSFRGAMKYRRGLIPADGFYEWRKQGKTKQPFFIRARGGEPFAFAALYETYTDKDGGEIDTAAIVTTSANGTLAPIHERMPVIVPPENCEAWLDCNRVDAKQAAALVGRAPDDFLEAIPVSPRVNSVKNDDPENLAPAA